MVLISLQDDATPCWIAAAQGHVEPLRALLEAKADPNQADKVRPAPRVGWSGLRALFCSLLFAVAFSPAVPLWPLRRVLPRLLLLLLLTAFCVVVSFSLLLCGCCSCSCLATATAL